MNERPCPACDCKGHINDERVVIVFRDDVSGQKADIRMFPSFATLMEKAQGYGITAGEAFAVSAMKHLKGVIEAEKQAASKLVLTVPKIQV